MLSLRLACFIVILSVIRVDALKVQIFKDLKYKGLIYEHNSNTTDCHDVKEYAQGPAGSLKTDTCLMIYEQKGCNGNSFKLSRDMKDRLEDLHYSISSFQPCNENYGGSTIRLQMFDSSNNLILKYKDICGCQDLPSQVTTRLNKLNNFGNCISVYPNPTCSGDPVEIPGGQNGLSQNLPELGFFIRGVSACGVRRACVRLSSEIFKFEFELDTGKAAENIKSKMLDLATKTTFYNNGSATVFQEYEARKKVRESTTVSLSTSITKMHSSSVSSTVTSSTSETGFNLGIYKQTTKVTDTLKETYASQKSGTETESGSYTHEVESEFAVKQVIEVPPCVEYEIFSKVEVVENLPIIYDVYTKVTGESSGRRMTAEEVSNQVDELTFVEIIDEYTAVYKSRHSLMANIGVDTKISGEGKIIPGCRK